MRKLLLYSCLLYTSDAADERSSVDLGGRRIIKKKKRVHKSHHKQHNNKKQSICRRHQYTNNNYIYNDTWRSG